MLEIERIDENFELRQKFDGGERKKNVYSTDKKYGEQNND